MELGPRKLVFVKNEMKKVEESDSRRPTEKAEAKKIRSEVEERLTE
jgi:hypothetical protein